MVDIETGDTDRSEQVNYDKDMNALIKLLNNIGRTYTVFRRRDKNIRKILPFWSIRFIVKLQTFTSRVRNFFVPVVHRSSNVNVYHCGVQKTGSQWIKSMLSDLTTYRYSGLMLHHYKARRIKNRLTRIDMDHPFPAKNFVSTLYFTYENFQNIPKNKAYKVFFVMRDPRDLVVSWYFSAKQNHIVKNDPKRGLYQHRKALNELSLDDGLIYTIDSFKERGIYELLRSWKAATDDPNVMIVRFEDLTAEDNFGCFRQLFDFIDVTMPDDQLRDLIDAYSFRRLTGRKPGTQDTNSHLRSGTSGGWRKYFNNEILKRFDEAAGDLISELGYQ